MPEPDPVRCAVIGTKNIAGQHIPVLQALPEAEVAALCDIDAEAVGETSRRFGVAQTFNSVDELMAWGEFDAVYVLVSVMAVAEVAERFIRAGVPTFLEKPPGCTPPTPSGWRRRCGRRGRRRWSGSTAGSIRVCRRGARRCWTPATWCR